MAAHGDVGIRASDRPRLRVLPIIGQIAASSASGATGLTINTGDGRKPVTWDAWDRSWAQMCVLHPGSVEPGDEETRAEVERVRHAPDTRRLVGRIAKDQSMKGGLVGGLAPVRKRGNGNREARPRARRTGTPTAPKSRTRTRPNAQARDGPGSSADDPPEHDLARRALVGGAA